MQTSTTVYHFCSSNTIGELTDPKSLVPGTRLRIQHAILYAASTMATSTKPTASAFGKSSTSNINAAAKPRPQTRQSAQRPSRRRRQPRRQASSTMKPLDSAERWKPTSAMILYGAPTPPRPQDPGHHRGRNGQYPPPRERVVPACKAVEHQLP